MSTRERSARRASSRTATIPLAAAWSGVGEGAIFPGRPAWHGEGSVHRPSTAPQTRSTQAGTPAVAETVDGVTCHWLAVTRPKRPGDTSPRRCPASRDAGQPPRPVRPRAAWERTREARRTRPASRHGPAAHPSTRSRRGRRAKCPPRRIPSGGRAGERRSARGRGTPTCRRSAGVRPVRTRFAAAPGRVRGRRRRFAPLDRDQLAADARGRQRRGSQGPVPVRRLLAPSTTR